MIRPNRRFARATAGGSPVDRPASACRGAFEHLVRPSRSGAPTRPTIAAVISGRVRHSPYAVLGPRLALRRNATFGNYLGRRSRIAKRPSVHLMTVRAPRIPIAITSRVTTDHSASRPDPRYGRAYRSIHFALHRSPPGFGRRSPRPARFLRRSDRARPRRLQRRGRAAGCAGRQGRPARHGPLRLAPDRG